MPFHYLYQQALVAGVASATANPSGLSPRALVEADTWMHFRLTQLQFRIHPSAAASGAAQLAGFVGGVQDTPPGTILAVAELLPSTVLGSRATSPSAWVRVPKSELAGPIPWYKTITGTADATEEYPGQLIFVGTGTETITVETRGVFEFKGSVATANTPAALKLREELRELRQSRAHEAERLRLLSVLGRSTGKQG